MTKKEHEKHLIRGLIELYFELYYILLMFYVDNVLARASVLQASPLWRQLENDILARAVGVPVGRCSGGRLVMTLLATKNIFIFPFFLRRHLFS